MRTLRILFCLGVVAIALSVPVGAHAPSGAIFTTVEDGREVNFNIYPSKEAVYLDGGPGPGAPQTAAGLDDGFYLFQVTDPSGKMLLSSDAVGCRRFHVANGIIDAYTPVECAQPHLTGVDIDHGGVTIQLMPYDNTPNHGGVYKVWVTFEDDYGCFPDLSQVDCAVDKHGFTPSHTKTDNFKVKPTPVIEIDTRFFNDVDGDGDKGDSEEFIDGLQVTWIDTHGASNTKWSYWAPDLNVFHEAHVEAPEVGTHSIVIDNQPGCLVGTIHADGEHLPVDGPQIVNTTISRRDKELTIFIDVACMVQ
jgi:hypothetical protein